MSEDDDLPGRASAPRTLRDIALHGRTHHNDDPAACISHHPSRFVTTSKNSFHHTLSAVLEEVNQLFLFVIKFHDVSVLTTDLCITSLIISFLLYHPDVGTLHVHLVPNDITSVPAYLQAYRQALKLGGFSTNVSNAPPSRPAPKPHPTGPHQSSIAKFICALAGLETTHISKSCGPYRQRRDNKPPPRPAPNPYPTGPHQRSIKRPYKPPPRPAPNPYPTGPHQS